MTNRCRNTGLGRPKPFLSRPEALRLRGEIDEQIDRQIQQWYAEVPFASHFEGEAVHREYYARHLAETALRIRLLRVAESKALAEIAKISPEAAQIWANYEREEMLHDELFIKDLEKAGWTRERFLATEPYLTTKLLAGFFSYLLDHEGPLGVVAYSYLVEYVNVKLEPKKIAAMRETIGEREIAGQISHAHTDVNEDHPGEVWDAVHLLIRNADDIDHLKRYLVEHQRILAMYFHEIHDDIVGNGTSQKQTSAVAV